ncbi:hypothetical protein [Abyssisolibacter fermentans]|uniref:hypothetical protein n=1 Tax=Abyssisolibacter fermentans TaxID=1766203 RepID=UPI00082D09D9|nr:hypothetical protein [Abyssisolibacter fermentans]
METGIVFMKRTPKEIEIFGGDVFIDINGKNIAKLRCSNIQIPLSEGKYKVKMYKSHTYDTVIGITEIEVNIKHGEKLLIKYSAPMLVNQSGNITVLDYINERNVEDMVKSKDARISDEFEEKQRIQREQEQKNNNIIIIIVAIIIISSIIGAIQMAELTSY